MENTKKPFNAQEYYENINKQLKNRAFQDVDEKTQRKINELVLKNWDKRVNPVDMLYADALALGGYEFFNDYINGNIDPVFAITIIKALRKREAIHEAKLINAIISTSSAAAIGGKKARPALKKLSDELNQEAYDE